MSGHLSQWPADQPLLRPLLCVYFAVINIVVGNCLARRLGTLFPNPFRKLRTLSIARAAILALLVDSWLLAFASTVLIFGVELSSSQQACGLAVWLCIVREVSFMRN